MNEYLKLACKQANMHACVSKVALKQEKIHACMPKVSIQTIGHTCMRT